MTSEELRRWVQRDGVESSYYVSGETLMVLFMQLDAIAAERNAANRDKGYLSTAILQELPQEIYLKVFDRYHKERGTYSQAQPTYLPEPKDRNLAEAWAERDGDI